MMRILTTSVTVSSDFLILTIPALSYVNGWNYLLKIGQEIPSSTLPVVIQIGETQYPFRQKGGNNVYANQLKQRGSYIIRAAADTKQFVLIHGWLNALNIGNVATLP